MEILPPPPPSEILSGMLWWVSMSALLFAGAMLLRHVAKGRILRFLAFLLAGTAAIPVAVFALALVYPHNHHDTQWIAGKHAWNYPVDFAIGATLLGVVALGATMWRRKAERSVAAWSSNSRMQRTSARRKL